MKRLVVPDKGKWYHLLILSEDGSTEEIEFPDMGNYQVYGSPFVDHVPNPYHVALYAKAKGYGICQKTMELLVGRWILETTDKFDKIYELWEG